MTRIGKIQLDKEVRDKKLMTRGGNKRVKKKEKWIGDGDRGEKDAGHKNKEEETG